MKKVVIIAAVLLLLVGFAAAAEHMKHLKIVATVTGGVRWSQVALGPDGIAHFTFEEDTDRGHPIWYFSYDGTKSSTLFNITSSMDLRGERPTICTNKNGFVGVGWGQPVDEEVWCRIYDPVQKQWLAKELIAEGYGGDEVDIALDIYNNVYVFWYNDGSGKIYIRAKINGAWEPIYKIAPQWSYRATQGGIAAGNDGQVWVLWREKEDNGEYKNWYSKRTKDTAWAKAKRMNDAGASTSHPDVTVGPDNIFYASWGDVDESSGSNQESWVCKIDEITNPRFMAIGLLLQHYPRIAVDPDLNMHVASQLGAGAGGDGILYTNNIGGTWKDFQVMRGTWPKLPGLAADAYGNVVACFSSQESYGSDIYMNSLELIVPKYFYPPVNLSSAIAVKSFKKSPELKYTLSWSANPENNDSYLQGYNIYKKEGTGDWEPALSVSKSTLTAEFTYTDLGAKRQFAIRTVSSAGMESEMVYFQ